MSESPERPESSWDASRPTYALVGDIDLLRTELGATVRDLAQAEQAARSAELATDEAEAELAVARQRVADGEALLELMHPQEGGAYCACAVCDYLGRS